MNRSGTGRQALTTWVRGFAGLLVEVQAGLRPARHLRPFLAPPLQHAVHSRRDIGIDTFVRQVLVQQRQDVAHAVVLIETRGRVSALALTVARDRYGAVVIDLGSPEDGLMRAPEPPSTPALALTTWHTVERDSERPRWQLPDGWRPRQPAASALLGAVA